MHNQHQHQQLKEGLRADDLKEMVHSTFEVDSFRSKMGEDQDVCVISFKVNDRSPAKDLMEFIEKGYAFVLDADVSSGEDNRGEYSVFVEISRTAKLSEQIKELTYGVKKLTGLDDLKFKYHKESQVHEATEENLKKKIPDNSSAYQGLMDRMRTESVRGFFTKTLMDDLTLDGDVITIHKPFDRSIKLQIVKDGATESILEGIDEGYTVDETASSEMFWLTKVLGDYHINKVGENFVFNNGARSMLLKRTEQ
jgi:DNA-dependent RNA polymerase auxiliary subunit epsilon